MLRCKSRSSYGSRKWNEGEKRTDNCVKCLRICYCIKWRCSWNRQNMIMSESMPAPPFPPCAQSQYGPGPVGWAPWPSQRSLACWRSSMMGLCPDFSKDLWARTIQSLSTTGQPECIKPSPDVPFEGSTLHSRIEKGGYICGQEDPKLCMESQARYLSHCVTQLMEI